MKKKVKVLVVVDMQNDFINGSLGSEAAQAIVPNVVDRIKNGGYDVIVATVDIHFDEDYLNTQEGKWLPVKHCINGTTGVELNEEVRLALREYDGEHPKRFIVLDKHTFGAIKLPHCIDDLVLYHDEEPGEIDIVGLCTDICVINNAMILKAAYPEAKMSVYANCCAGSTELAHKLVLRVMRSCQIDVIYGTEEEREKD